MSFPGAFEIILQPGAKNILRVSSVIKTDRIVTLKKEDIITVLGTISSNEIIVFKEKFKQLAD